MIRILAITEKKPEVLGLLMRLLWRRMPTDLTAGVWLDIMPTRWARFQCARPREHAKDIRPIVHLLL